MQDKNDTFIFKQKTETIRVYCKDIVFFESFGHYIGIHMKNGEVYRTRGTMTSLAQLLDKDRFVRVHRGIVVNLKYVRAIHKNDIMLDAVWKCVPVSRSCREKLENTLEIYNE